MNFCALQILVPCWFLMSDFQLPYPGNLAYTLRCMFVLIFGFTLESAKSTKCHVKITSSTLLYCHWNDTTLYLKKKRKEKKVKYLRVHKTHSLLYQSCKLQGSVSSMYILQINKQNFASKQSDLK